MAGQLALVTGGAVAAAAVWETLPVETQRAVTVALARLAVRVLEAGRHSGRDDRRGARTVARSPGVCPSVLTRAGRAQRGVRGASVRAR